jgi:N-methylhydantoinase A
MMDATAPSTWIGIDTGGTFTDVVLVDRATETYWFRKVPSNPADPAEAILRGLDEILGDANLAGSHVAFIGLGTTLATNAILEGKTGHAAMLTTAGFRDILELARQRRPHLYNLDVPKPRAPIAVQDRIEVLERIGAEGEHVIEPDTSALEHALGGTATSAEAFAVCFLHSFRNPAHEQRAADVLRRKRPDVQICLSSDVSPEFREYERFATTVVNAALLPVMTRYLEQFRKGVADRGVPATPYVLQSNGGLVSPTTVQRLPINTFFSGPAGGVIGAVRAAGAASFDDIITFDIGGTSTDVCLVRGRRPARATLRHMGGLPVRTASIDLHTIGAGGGSIAWVDAGGLPKVGPESAGASPGPACYGRGGLRPTVTDANVLLGRLNPVALLGGRMPIDAAKAEEAVRRYVGDILGIDPVQAAGGILDIANVNMTGAVRVISVERGEDPRGYALFAFGGGGPLHAAQVADAIGMRRVIVPPHPGLMSAMGLLAASIRADFGLTCLTAATLAGLPAVITALHSLLARGRAWSLDEGLDPASVRFDYALELRYLGQSSELLIGMDGGLLDEIELAAIVARFHGEHRQRFGYSMPDRPVEVVTARLTASVSRETPPEERSAAPREVPPSRRPVWFRDTGFADTPVYDRAGLAVDGVISGPAIIEQMDTTTVVPPGWSARLDPKANLLMERTEHST